MKSLPLSKFALLQLIIFSLFIIVNMYSFFSDAEMDTIVLIVQIIMFCNVLLGVLAFTLNFKYITKTKNKTTLEVLSIISLSLITGISLMALLIGIIGSFLMN